MAPHLRRRRWEFRRELLSGILRAIGRLPWSYIFGLSGELIAMRSARPFEDLPLANQNNAKI